MNFPRIINKDLGPAESVEAIYQLMLLRPVDPAGQESWNEVIEQGGYSALTQIEAIAGAEEFKVAFDSIPRRERIARTLSMLRLIKKDQPSETLQSELIFRFMLNRQIDDVGAASCARRIDRGKFSALRLVARLAISGEFREPYLRPTPTQQLHAARSAWVGQLPAAKRVLDIGGSSPTLPEGALIELGYAHRPEKLIIFDKPPNEQFWGTPNYSQDNTRDFEWGTVQYIHGYAEDILKNDELSDQEFDMIYMGQVVEHIYEDKLVGVLKWIGAHLAPDGTFFFDTPNRRITLHQTGEGNFIDPDHKTEYTPEDFVNLLDKAGLVVSEEWGILEMPNVVANQRFSVEDYYGGAELSSSAADGYCFAFACQTNSN